jgi:serine/threonine protein kinase
MPAATNDPRDPTAKRATTDSGLAGLNPLGLLDGVLGGQSTDWEPPSAESLEPSFPGYTDFVYLDRGGMGAVYSAVQTSLQRRVAIKILPPELVEDESFMIRFQQEAHLLARLQHPHIVAVYDFGITQAGYHYIVMEFVEGVSLLEVIRREKLSITRHLNIVAQVCEALFYAHGRGVIHRDIKPSNILIDERGFVRVADFGLAKSSHISNSTSSAGPRTKAFMGTVGYAAPEQREKNSTIDFRSDIFSLGVTLYEMLTGQLPVGVFDPPSKKAGTPAHVDKIIRRALMQSPEDRYPSAQEMRNEIAKALLRMGTPLVQRAIISKPIVSMVTCVIVGMGIIYLLDGVNDVLVLNQQHLTTPQPYLLRSDDGAAKLIPLDDQWAIVSQSWHWEKARQKIAQLPDWQFAEIHSEDEQEHVAALLREHGQKRPLWLAATSDRSTARAAFHWLSGAAVDYQAWMPPGEQPPIIITEIQAKNNNSLLPKNGETPDWIEVHNPSAKPADLAGYQLRQYFGRAGSESYVEERILTSSEPSTVLQPGEYRVICCSPRMKGSPVYLVLPFTIEGSRARLEWSGPQGWIWQHFPTSWVDFPADASIGISPDGKTWGWHQSSTPGQPNSPITAPFPAPQQIEPVMTRIILLPEFGSLWTRNSGHLSQQSLVRKIRH